MAKQSKIMPPSSNKYKKVKRPTVLVKRNQLKRKSISKPRNLLYEKLKANNNALARALSKEKQDHQYTFSHSLALTSQIQEMQISLNKRDEILSKILQNSKQGLELLVKATGYLTDTIQSCRSIVQTEPLHLRISSSRSPMPRRESSRQSVVKSPARGVVQPMVSGHTITKPVINLSRINMPRVRTSPNLSDIEESIISTPERSSLQIDNSSTTTTTAEAATTNNNNNNNNATATSFIRLPVNQQNGFSTGRVERLLPERIRVSAARISDEIDDLSDNNNISRRSTSKRTSRNSRRESRNSERLSVVNLESRFNNETLPEMFKSPRVALQDVSRFLRNNTQTINVKTFMENDKLSESWTAPTYGFDSRKHETKNSNNEDDPLEGPSWMHNSEPVDIDQNNSDADNNIKVSNCSRINPSETYVISSLSSPASVEAVAVAASAQIDEPPSEDDPNDSSQIEWAKNSCTVSSSSSDDDNDNNDNYNVDDNNKSVNYSKYLSVNTRARRINNYVSNDNDIINTTRNVSKYSSADTDSPKSRKFSTRVDDGDNDDNEDDDDDEKCGEWGSLAASINTRARKTDDFENNNLLRVSTNVTVARSRQPIDDDDDDFTMLIKKRPCPTRNLPFDINELDLPVLERPLIETPQVEPEPDFTTEINMITRLINMPATPRTSIRESLMDSINNSSALIPQINESMIRTSTELENLETIENTRDSFIGHPDVLKRKRINKHRFASSSDSEPSSPLEKISKCKRKNVKRKDPSSAKVVLEKLDESNKKITSITSRNSSNSILSLQLDQQSDSDSSNASSRISGRPRRRKAPTNLKEPRLGTKLRRQ
ncbi:probable serine/threonine-protein kinase DDB_G0282963 isoform X2 [Microplitis demolitor]|uniref:probable serine/threonine-protein kinase DDB_G0282963 isoform X2 n=1 Tax=Microplitis demolitor TaxID=69319 RepID=UPI0004CD99AE|nr:probable serine/threonine-protein kinase DDB_G0282963 isoform X2 [Microplitis demolitor]